MRPDPAHRRAGAARPVEERRPAARRRAAPAHGGARRAGPGRLWSRPSQPGGCRRPRRRGRGGGRGRAAGDGFLHRAAARRRPCGVGGAAVRRARLHDRRACLCGFGAAARGPGRAGRPDRPRARPCRAAKAARPDAGPAAAYRHRLRCRHQTLLRHRPAGDGREVGARSRDQRDQHRRAARGQARLGRLRRRPAQDHRRSGAQFGSPFRDRPAQYRGRGLPHPGRPHRQQGAADRHGRYRGARRPACRAPVSPRSPTN